MYGIVVRWNLRLQMYLTGSDGREICAMKKGEEAGTFCRESECIVVIYEG